MTYDEKIAWAIEMALKTLLPHDDERDIMHEALVYLKIHKEVGEQHFAYERERAQELNKKKQQENEV